LNKELDRTHSNSTLQSNTKQCPYFTWKPKHYKTLQFTWNKVEDLWLEFETWYVACELT